MEFKHKLKLLLNDPSFKRSISLSKSQKVRVDPSKSQQPKQLLFRNVFPSKLEIERFRHLEQARVNTIQDMHLSKNVDHSIQKMQQALKQFAKKDRELQLRRDSFFGKFKMDYVEQQMNENLEDLNTLVKKHQNLYQQIKEERSLIQKSLKMTQIKKALKIQNELLKIENEKLKQQQKRLDTYLSATVKK